MVVPDGEWEAVGRDAHAVIDEAKAAGVYVFGGGIDETVPPVLVSADGTFSAGGYSHLEWGQVFTLAVKWHHHRRGVPVMDVRARALVSLGRIKERPVFLIPRQWFRAAVCK
jgi:hypothetical protein